MKDNKTEYGMMFSIISGVLTLLVLNTCAMSDQLRTLQRTVDRLRLNTPPNVYIGK